MSTQIIINSYSKLDFHSWVVKGENNGLDESIISRIRAIAQMNNPDADSNDILMTTANFNGICIGYRGVFPEKIIQKNKIVKIGWVSTFFIEPKYRGKGIAKSLMKPIENCYNNQLCVIHSSKNAQRVYLKKGWKISFLIRTTFLFRIHKPRNYANNTILKRLLNIFRPLLNWLIGLFHYFWLNKSYKHKYQLEYTDIIDNRLYKFISDHTYKELFPKSKARLNWILRYKWVLASPCIQRTNDDYYFSNYLKDYFQCGVIVKSKNKIIGFFVISKKNGHLSIPYLYYDKKRKTFVFRSILEHVIELKASSLSTFNKNLIEYINKDSQLISFAKQNMKISYSHTRNSFFNNEYSHIQDGDGDLFF